MNLIEGIAEARRLRQSSVVKWREELALSQAALARNQRELESRKRVTTGNPSLDAVLVSLGGTLSSIARMVRDVRILRAGLPGDELFLIERLGWEEADRIARTIASVPDWEMSLRCALARQQHAQEILMALPNENEDSLEIARQEFQLLMRSPDLESITTGDERYLFRATTRELVNERKGPIGPWGLRFPAVERSNRLPEMFQLRTPRSAYNSGGNGYDYCLGTETETLNTLVRNANYSAAVAWCVHFLEHDTFHDRRNAGTGDWDAENPDLEPIHDEDEEQEETDEYDEDESDDTSP